MKKLKIMIMSMAFALISFGVLVNVNADTLKYKVCTPVKTKTYDNYTVYSSKYVTPYGYVNSYSNQSSRIVFCFEHGIPMIKSSGRTFTSYKLSGSKLNKGIGYAGWYVNKDAKESPSCSNSRVAAQVFVHMMSYDYKKKKDFLTISDSTLKTRVKSMLSTSSSNEESIAKHVTQIRTLYNVHGKKPTFKSATSGVATNKFDSCTYDEDKGKYTCKKVLTETSGVLQKVYALSSPRFHFKIDKPSGVDVSRSGNKVTVTATIDDSKINNSISIAYKRTRLSDKSVVKKSVIGGNVQDMAMSVPTEYLETTTVKLYADIDTATIKVKKFIANTDGKTLDGAELYLYDDNDCTERSQNYQGNTFTVRTTANGGLASWEGVIYEENRIYYVGEKESDEYEELCVPVTPIKPASSSSSSTTTAANDEVNIIENIPKGSGSIEIQKTNQYTDKPLRGRLFGVYLDEKCEENAEDVDGNAQEVKSTDENGIITWEKLPYPSAKDSERVYYVKEIFSTDSNTFGDGYTIDKTAEVYKNAKDYCIPVPFKEKGKDFEKNVKKTLKITNIPYGNLTVLKQDVDTGASIKGAVFALYKSDGKTLAENIDGKKIGNITTNASGVAKFESVPYGDYILREIKTPEGYKKLEKDLKITLNEDTNSLKYQGQRIIGVPANQAMTSYKLGDVDGDERITSKDLAFINDFIEKNSKNEKVSITANQKYAADIDKDGSIKEADATLLKAYLDGDKLAFKALEHGVFILGDKTYNLGDPTNDGKIDEKDLKMAKDIYLGEITKYTDLEYYACDLNNDGTVNYQDINLFEIYLGTGKISETLEPQLTIDLNKIDYNVDKKYDLKDIYFLKGVIIGSGGEIVDYTYDFNEDDQITSEDVTLLDSYIDSIGKERAYDITGKSEVEINEYLNKIYEYKNKEIEPDKPAGSTPETGTTETPTTKTEEEQNNNTVLKDEYLKYDYDKSGKIDDTDIVILKIDHGDYNVDYDKNGKIDASDKDLLNSLISGIANKSNTSFIYDLNNDESIDDVDLILYTSYVEGDKNLFEKVEITNDVNKDGKVDENDLKLVEAAIEKKDTATANKAADVNNDGVIDNDDIISIKKAIGGYKEFNVLDQMVVSYEEKISIAVTNVPLDVLISKQNITNSKEVEGARIVIKDSKGNKVIDYVSKTKAKKFYLATGTYVLTETVTPIGYQKLVNNIKFKVQADGNVKILSAKSNMYKVKKTKDYGEYDHLIVYNTPKVIKAPKTGSVKSVLEVLGGILLIGSGGYFVYYRSKKNNLMTK